jgi:hypothetical protein
MESLAEPSGAPPPVAHDAAAATTTLALPHALACAVFARLPVDARLRACEVSRGWQATLADVGLWARLDLSAESGGLARAATDALLLAAAAKAGGALQSLNVSGCARITEDVLLAVAADNADALTELRASSRHARDFFTRVRNGYGDDACRSFHAVQALLRAAPALQLLHTDLECTSEADMLLLARALRNENEEGGAARFAPLRVRRLVLRDDDLFLHNDAPDELMPEMVAALATHASLTACSLYNMPHGVDALSSMVQSPHLPHLRACRVWDGDVSAATLPALLRLASAPLTELAFDLDDALTNADAAALAAALHANTTLTSLQLDCTWGEPAVVAALLGALTGHGSLRKLGLNYGYIEGDDAGVAQQALAGAALGALLAADAPALEELEMDGSDVYDASLRPLFGALPANSHLRTLILNGSGNHASAVSAAFARDVLLPAVRANGSLTRLSLGTAVPWDSARQAEQLVQQRRRQQRRRQQRQQSSSSTSSAESSSTSDESSSSEAD